MELDLGSVIRNQHLVPQSPFGAGAGGCPLFPFSQPHGGQGGGVIVGVVLAFPV